MARSSRRYGQRHKLALGLLRLADLVEVMELASGSNCGIAKGGFQPGNDCARGTGGSAGRTRSSRKAPKQRKDSVKSARAKAAYVPATKEKQQASDQLEIDVASALGATRSGDNLPMDVVAKRGRKEIGLEVKMIHDGKDTKVHMRKDSRQRKEAWLEEKPKNREAYTVVIDNRDQFENGAHKDKYSGHRIYFKQGVGAFRLNSMERASSMKDLKKKLGL